MHTEIIKFGLGVRSKYIGPPPSYKVLIDDTILYSSNFVIDSVDSTTTHVKADNLDFDISVEPGEHTFKIRFDAVPGYWSNIEIYQFNLNGKEYSKTNHHDFGKVLLLSKYILDEPRMIDGEHTNIQTHTHVLGWSGTFELPFSSPMLFWFLENF